MKERIVNLVSYLPHFLAEYKEINITLTAENPEFQITWDAAKKVLYNEFIETADEYGISRFENLLKILPSKEDTLESRRSRVRVRWFSFLPYTWRVFIKKLITLCGENNFTATKKFEFYQIDLEVNLELFGQVDELEHLIETVIPCNMIVTANNKILCPANGVAFVAGGVSTIDFYTITDENSAITAINGTGLHGGGIVYMESITIIDNF